MHVGGHRMLTELVGVREEVYAGCVSLQTLRNRKDGVKDGWVRVKGDDDRGQGGGGGEGNESWDLGRGGLGCECCVRVRVRDPVQRVKGEGRHVGRLSKARTLME